ncbi:thioredoxin domain-containing protein [Effusibacillus dendaii]|uniref:Uncharacterized protein n=1 Tax=Effusibacillus dendaii TaxID=2743772 RepID=A0A7I8D8N8_9BACL|nr:hypothetical protein [Effusibacillus dendaii]BCJ86367.1 hypothetical protein skT53_13520 [Effusibacillus dendaii]
MVHIIKKHWFTSIVVLLVLAFIGGIYYWVQWATARPPVNNTAPHFQVMNQAGQTADFFDLSHKVRVVYFFNYESSAAVQDMIHLQQTLKQKGLFGKDVVLVPVPLDKRLSPDLISEYQTTYKADLSGWWFPKGDSAKISSGFGLKLNHSGQIDTQGRDYTIVETDRNNIVRRVINGSFRGNALDVEEGSHGENSLLQDINFLAKE